MCPLLLALALLLELYKAPIVHCSTRLTPREQL